MKLSIVIPVYNEVGSIDALYKEIKQNIDIEEYEIVYIDDGSTDGSSEKIQELIQDNQKIKLIQFYRNYGKSAALSEGFKQANGEYVITMDADLQDDPAEIKNLIDKLEEGFDLVSGWKKNRKDPISKRLPSKLFNFITRLFTSVKIHDFNCGLKIYRRSVIKTLDINKAQDIVSIDLKDKSSMADYMIIASGTSSRHIQSLSEQVLEKLKDNGIENSKIEGKDSVEWKLVDGIDLIVHIFHPEKRRFYELEKIWSELIPKEKLII